MSNLFPGGSRGKGGRVFGAANIERTIRGQVPDYGKRAAGSIAGQPHENNGERARRERQRLRREAKKNGR